MNSLLVLFITDKKNKIYLLNRQKQKIYEVTVKDTGIHCKEEILPGNIFFVC